MILKFQLLNWRFTFTIAPVTTVTGVNSQLQDGNHILMWDFDDTTFETVVGNLIRTQRIYALPNIYILETKKDTNYIAYCLKRLPWRKVVEIIAFTKGVDKNFFKYGVYRERFTLRVSPKGKRKPKLVYVLRTESPEDVDIKELTSWVQYQTLIDGWKSRKMEVVL